MEVKLDRDIKKREMSLGESQWAMKNASGCFKTELIQQTPPYFVSPLTDHSGNWSHFVKTQLELWADWNHLSLQHNAVNKTGLFKSDIKLRTKGLSAQEGKYPTDVINRCIINPILCLGATRWLHTSATLSNPGVSIRKKKNTLKYVSGHGVRCLLWNIHNVRAEPQ